MHGFAKVFVLLWKGNNAVYLSLRNIWKWSVTMGLMKASGFLCTSINLLTNGDVFNMCINSSPWSDGYKGIETDLYQNNATTTNNKERQNIQQVYNV